MAHQSSFAGILTAGFTGIQEKPLRYTGTDHRSAFHNSSSQSKTGQSVISRSGRESISSKSFSWKLYMSEFRLFFLLVLNVWLALLRAGVAIPSNESDSHCLQSQSSILLFSQDLCVGWGFVVITGVPFNGAIKLRFWNLLWAT